MVRVERQGPVTTVVLDRPQARNAVDGPTAAALADAFRAFDADDEAAVAVLHGEGGTFCAGADLKAGGAPTRHRTDPHRGGPVGAAPRRAAQPGVAAVARPPGARGAGG